MQKNYLQLTHLMFLLTTLFAHPALATEHFHYQGYVDSSYNYLVRSNHFTSGEYDRDNDLAENGFTLQQAALTVSYQPTQGFGGLLNTIVGRDANPLAPYGWNPYFGSQMLALVVPKAYLQFASGSYTFIGGIVDAETGAESYEPTNDTNFSRSILDQYAEPGPTLGVRTYLDLEHLRINLGLNNGWSGLRDTSRPLSYELGARWTVNSVFSWMVQGLFGEQRLITRTATGPTGRRNFVEIVATYKATDALTFIASGDYGVQSKARLANNTIGRAVWQGVNAYANYQLTEKCLASLRGEIYLDTQGYTTGVNQNWREVTLTLGYQPIKAWVIRAESRHDFSNVNAFVNRGASGGSNNQQSYAIETLYQF